MTIRKKNGILLTVIFFKHERSFSLNTQASYLHKLRYFFYILMVAIFGWFLFMELFGPDEQSANRTSTAALYSGTFVWEKADGTSEEIKVPGRYRVPAGETMVLTTTLPDNYDETAFAIRSSLQDVKFYIGGELRAEYSTKETRLVGKNFRQQIVFALLPIRMQEKNFVWN